eukprot:TRINITY_DN3270_c0_g1_i1.p1 TRINITY_DN3270_c0_g1~~TRINITY_DN3270_c0_g1_i1.p1  ORF type:complete len:1045 (+),score=239.98 TRINITY_DN3270_c0_g1_i1:68-3202(+)
MMRFFKAESALQRAEELIKVKQYSEALEALRYVITSRRHRTWQKTLEKLMLKYLDLCVQLRRSKEAKDGLHQYRSTCQQVNISSLGVVIKHFIQTAEEQAEEARSKAKQMILDIEDLEADEIPESVLLGQVSGEDTKDRTDREIVTPWLKFLWETYRTVLDILRNNSKLENLYADTASKAFEFCKEYERKMEFRRLSEILRNHLENLAKYAHQLNAISLTNPVSLNLHLQTRFSQLNVACDLELWQEAFKSIKDIHGLMTLSKTVQLKPVMMANYYDKLAQIFWVSKNHLFHAYARYKYYTLCRNQNTNLSADELKEMASSVVLAALAVPIDEPRSRKFFQFNDMQKEKFVTLAALLGPVTAPSRKSLIRELVQRGVVQQVVGPLQNFHHLLEEQFQPLTFCQSLQEKLQFISESASLQKYSESLQHVMLIHLLRQLSRVYHTLKISELAKLTYFIHGADLDKALVEIVKVGYVRLRIDHNEGVLRFACQSLEAKEIRGQFTLLSRKLEEALSLAPTQIVAVPASKVSSEHLCEEIEKEHQRLLQRKRNINRRKKIEEQIAKVRQEMREEDVAQAEQDRREEVRRRREEREARLKAEQERIAMLKEQREKIADILRAQDPDVAAKIKSVEIKTKEDADSLREEIDALVEKVKRIRETKLLRVYKQVDHFQRAKREKELDRMKEAEEKRAAEISKYQELRRQELLKAQVQKRARLLRMLPNKEIFAAKLLERRQEEYQKNKAAQDLRIEAEKKRFIEERKQKIAEEERLAAERVRQAAERKQREAEMEEERKKAEEERRLRGPVRGRSPPRRSRSPLRDRGRSPRRSRSPPPRSRSPRRSRSPPRDGPWRNTRGPRRSRSPPPRGSRSPERGKFATGGSSWRKNPEPRGRRSPPRGRRSPPRGRRSPPRGRRSPPRDRGRSPPRRYGDSGRYDGPARGRSPRSRSPSRGGDRDRSPPRRRYGDSGRDGGRGDSGRYGGRDGGRGYGRSRSPPRRNDGGSSWRKPASGGRPASAWQAQPVAPKKNESAPKADPSGWEVVSGKKRGK